MWCMVWFTFANTTGAATGTVYEIFGDPMMPVDLESCVVNYQGVLIAMRKGVIDT